MHFSMAEFVFLQIGNVCSLIEPNKATITYLDDTEIFANKCIAITWQVPGRKEASSSEEHHYVFILLWESRELRYVSL